MTFTQWSESAKYGDLDTLTHQHGLQTFRKNSKGYRYDDNSYIIVDHQSLNESDIPVGYFVEIGNHYLETFSLAEAETYLWENWSKRGF